MAVGLLLLAAAGAVALCRAAAAPAALAAVRRGPTHPPLPARLRGPSPALPAARGLPPRQPVAGSPAITSLHQNAPPAQLPRQSSAGLLAAGSLMGLWGL
eukprot:EG_transcript_59404